MTQVIRYPTKDNIKGHKEKGKTPIAFKILYTPWGKQRWMLAVFVDRDRISR